MFESIAVVSGKGGTGKTSFVAGVGAALAAQGKRTLCLDCDAGLRNLDLALGISDRVVMDFTDVIAGRTTLDTAIVYHPQLPKLAFLAAPLAPTEGREPSCEQMRALMAQIAERFDYCLVDAPAGIGTWFRLAAGCANRAVVISTTDPTSLRDAQRTVMELAAFPSGTVHLVVNRVRRRVLRALCANIDEMMDEAGLPLLGLVPEDEDQILSIALGTPLVLTSNRCAAVAYGNIARRLRGQSVPLMNIK